MVVALWLLLCGRCSVVVALWSCVYRVIIAILDNFHFDLSHVTTETSDSNFTLQKGMDDTTTPTKKAETDEMEQERKADMILDDEEEKGEEESGDVKGREVEDEDELHKNEKTAKLVDQEERKLSLSQNIYNVIVKNILPKLQEVLTKKVCSKKKSYIF